MKNKTMKTNIKHSTITEAICKNFTIEDDTEHIFEPHCKADIQYPKNFNIGLIVGASGTGKSILLNEFGQESIPLWDENDAIASHFRDYEDAVDRLMAVGMNSIPHWLVPYDILSNGQRYRVDTARNLRDGAVADEFTSIIDRNTALSMCNSIQRHIRKKDLRGIVFASPHKDIINFLKPCWVYDTDNRTLTVNDVIYRVSDMTEMTFEKKEHFMVIKK